MSTLLESYLKQLGAFALAFSGGTDSAYLLYSAVNAGIKVKAYYVKTSFQPQFELEDAKRVASLLKSDMEIIEADVLSTAEISRNSADRCYFCKHLLLSTIASHASKDGFTLIADGTNASDDASDRPGMRALREMSVISPLRECGLTKDDIRSLSHEAGLFTWNKPAYACLATRITTGEIITTEKLLTTERAEDYLFSLGFTDFRIRMRGDSALIQLHASQFSLFSEKQDAIISELNQYYNKIVLDPEARS